MNNYDYYDEDDDLMDCYAREDEPLYKLTEDGEFDYDAYNGDSLGEGPYAVDEDEESWCYANGIATPF